jgi:hypothetical protein
MRVTGSPVSSVLPAETEPVLKSATVKAASWFVPLIVIPALLILLVMARVAYSRFLKQHP